MTLSVDVVSDIRDQVAAVEDVFLSEASLKRFQRARSWKMSEVTKAAAKGFTQAIKTTFDNPTPLMHSAMDYKGLRNRDAIAISHCNNAPYGMPRTVSISKFGKFEINSQSIEPFRPVSGARMKNKAGKGWN